MSDRLSPYLKFGVIAALLIAVGALVLKSDKAKKPDVATLEKIKAKGVVRVGYANEAPYAYMDTDSGRLTGESPEIARVVLGRMGVDRIEGVLTEFGSLIPGLKAGRFDMIAAGMYITPKRCEQVAFSDPTYTIGEAFIVKKGNPKNLHGFGDVAADPQATIGVVVGTVEHGYARELGVPLDRIVVFPDTPSAFAGVRAGRVDAFAGTDLTVTRLLRTSDKEDIEKAKPFKDPVINGQVAGGYGAFVFRQEDVRFRQAVNRELDAFIGSNEHLKLVEPFGFAQDNLPGDKTAKSLCGGI